MVDINKVKSSKKSSNRGKSKVLPGHYKLKVKKVELATGFIPGTAIDCFYELTSEKGEALEFKERFFTKGYHERTEKILDYFEEHGIDWNDFEGCTENVDIAYNEKKFPEIYNRVFISTPVDDKA